MYSGGDCRSGRGVGDGDGVGWGWGEELGNEC